MIRDRQLSISFNYSVFDSFIESKLILKTVTGFITSCKHIIIWCAFSFSSFAEQDCNALIHINVLKSNMSNKASHIKDLERTNENCNIINDFFI